jgi:hypothetical protein
LSGGSSGNGQSAAICKQGSSPWICADRFQHRWLNGSAAVMTFDSRMNISRSECFLRAEEAWRWAMASHDPAARRDLVAIERSWRLLAHSYESSETVT